jgi:nucleotide-binding universal stress UspA family protein
MKEGVDPHETVVVVKRILVAIDRSEYKEKIAAYAISLGKAWGAEMTAVHVVEPWHALPDGVEAEAKEQARITESKKQAENLLNEIGIWANKQGLNIKGEALEESAIVGKAIIDYAEKNNIDVIVIGTKGMSAVEEYFFGSVANKVILEARCPVFAIR